MSCAAKLFNPQNTIFLRVLNLVNHGRMMPVTEVRLTMPAQMFWAPRSVIYISIVCAQSRYSSRAPRREAAGSPSLPFLIFSPCLQVDRPGFYIYNLSMVGAQGGISTPVGSLQATTTVDSRGRGSTENKYCAPVERVRRGSIV